MNDNTKKNTIILIVLLVVFTLAYLLIKNLTKDDSLQYDEYLKNYEVNEYIPTYISDEDMAKIYLNDYITNMYYNVEKAYNSLDEEYRIKKFGNIEGYKSYVNSLNYQNYTLSKYYKKDSNGYIVFGVYDNNGNLFIFKTKGVMQYTVYLDDYTVEI